ncbi:MAG: hypothetical protein CM15mL4_1160 [uncultured marine virus]|nr:MAG: hypothetical protein CM15mL4_1160 [uncultured marine virus]
MSILSVDQISPIGSGTTVTLNATEIKTGNEITVGTGASIFSPAGNTLTFGTNNVERIRIKNDGAVGINTDVSGNGGGAKLVVGGRIQSNAGGYWFAGANGAEDGWHVQDSGGNFVVVESGVAERLRITSDGKFGFGTSSPDQTVHIHKGSAGSVSSTTNTVLTLENSTTNILQFLNPNNTVAQIRFGDPQDDGAGFIEYSHSTNTMSFGTNGGPNKNANRLKW